jgi:hypothetical protein
MAGEVPPEMLVPDFLTTEVDKYDIKYLPFLW